MTLTPRQRAERTAPCKRGFVAKEGDPHGGLGFKFRHELDCPTRLQPLIQVAIEEAVREEREACARIFSGALDQVRQCLQVIISASGNALGEDCEELAVIERHVRRADHTLVKKFEAIRQGSSQGKGSR